MWAKSEGASLEEKQLVLDCARGDVKAWEQLVTSFQGPIYGVVSRLLGPHEAEDVTQEVFLRTFKALPSFRGESRLSTWVYRIAVNLCRDRARYIRRRPVAFSLDEPLLAEEGEVGRQLADPAPSVDEHVQSLELGRQVEQAMRALPEFHRAVLVLHDMQGLKYEEIAQIMGCSLGTVKSRLFYARRKLGSMLGDYLVG